LQKSSARALWRNTLCTALACIACASATEQAHAQTTPERVIHLFVEPKLGDDALALANNPKSNGSLSDGCPQPPQPAQSPWGPIDYRDPQQSNAPMLNAPYPFKTVTAAISYISALQHPPTVTSGYDWKYAIIHCGDGLYAPDSFYTGTSGYHPDNAMKPNGETFPIRLPNYVSIQGTSALNTVFHAGGNPTVNQRQLRSVFQFGMSADNTGVGSFIDKISIYGAYEDPFRNHQNSAAIYCGQFAASTPTISNCWIFDNFVGLLLDAPESETPDFTWHQVTLTNNTFAWNQCGIWNGMTDAREPEPSWGVSRLIAINNLLDSNQTLSQENATGFGLPDAWVAFGGLTGIRTCFEGVAREDLTVASTAGTGGPIDRDFNAYECRPTANTPAGFGGYNWGDALFMRVSTLPVTRVPPTPTLSQPWAPGSVPNAAVNVSPITGNQSVNGSGLRDAERGTLYVRDLFYNGARSAGGYFEPDPNNIFFDHCPGDFRLSPAEATYTTGSPNQPQAQHRLVDAGWYPVSGVSEFPLVMQNGLQMGTNNTNGWPGFLTLAPADQPTWEFHNWNFDCEGIGNGRAWDHPAYSNTGYGGIDIGADELGGLVVAGYRFGTTHLFKLKNPRGLPVSTVQMDNSYLWYLGKPEPLGQQGAFGRPWWRKQPDSATTLPLWGGAWTWSNASSIYYFPPLMEITPHLLNDIHPYWAQFPPLAASNPIWQWCTGFYNPSLFWDPTHGLLNPPGVYPVLGTPFQWLDGQPSLTGTPPPAWPVFPSDYSWMVIGVGRSALFHRFDEWCAARYSVLGINGPRFDVLPATFQYPADPLAPVVLQAYRYSLEDSYEAGDSGMNPFGGPWWARAITGLPQHNVQSMLVLIETDPEPEPEASGN
jgi:hypothetical protein